MINRFNLKFNNRNIIKSINSNQFLPLANHTVYNEDKVLYSNRLCLRGEWDYSGTDSHEVYYENLKTQPKDWYYRHNKVKYTLNSEGYRTKEFKEVDWKNSVVMFGCSYVFGTGVDDKHTIPSFLEDLIGMPVINMGVGGSSIQLALHNSMILNDKYGPPAAVVYGWTSLMRYLIYHPLYFDNKIPTDSINVKSAEHLVPFNIMNVKIVRNLWKDRCKYYEFSVFESTANVLNCDFYQPKDDYARDLRHCGRQTNKEFAELINVNLSLL